MLKTSDPSRIQGCKDYGAEVILCENIKEAFAVMNEIAISENRTILHPFDSENMILGSASCGLEIIENWSLRSIKIIHARRFAFLLDFLPRASLHPQNKLLI